jgi:hypothetical protein
VLAVSAVVVTLPLIACAPVHPPEAVHEVALLVVQVSVEVPPLATLVGFAVSVTPGGADAAITVTVAVAAAGVVPLAPAQVSVKLVFAVNAVVVALPLSDCDPLQPPEAVHEVALVVVQVSIEVPPVVTPVGFAVNDTVGDGGIAVTVTLAVAAAGVVPLAPAQVRVKLASAVNALLVALPLVA